MELALDPEIKKRLNKNEKVKYLATYNKDNFTPDNFTPIFYHP